MRPNLFLFLFMSLVFFSCGNDDAMEATNEFIVIKDGETHIATNVLAELTVDNDYTQYRNGLRIQGNIPGGVFYLSVQNWEFQDPPANGILVKTYDTYIESEENTNCETDSGALLCDFAEGLFTTLTKFYSTLQLDEEDGGTLTITENDIDNLTVSGTFDINVVNFGASADETIHFTGSFNKLKYRI